MSTGSLGSPLTAFVRLGLYGGFTLVLMPIQVVALVFDLSIKRTMPVWYHRRCCRVLGIRIERRGRRSRVHPTLYVANHVSYLDVPVLAALIPVSFVAKSEVRDWPFFGWLARLQRTVFVERKASRASKPRNEMLERLAAGDDLVLFPEGTSGDGIHVLPFKSALLSVAEHWAGSEPLTIQPVSIAYTKLDGLPLGRHLRPFFAWYGDMDLAPHLWQLAGLGRLSVMVTFHPPVTLDEVGSRKALSRHCQALIAEGVATALAGRPRRSLAIAEAKTA